MEGGSSQKKKGKFKRELLIDSIFSWSLGDIFNECLYKDKVEKIPESFQSVQQYLGSFVFPLLEETRAELSSSMDLMSKAPFTEVVSIEESIPFGSLFYSIRINSWKNRCYNCGKEPYRTLPGDLFIISDVKPEIVSDLQQSGRIWTWAWVPKVSENGNSDDSAATIFKIKASRDIGIKDGLHKSLYVVFLMNITTNNRIWNSLHFFGNLNIIREVLCTNLMVEEICNQCSLYNNAICAERIGLKLPPLLNESQRAAVLCSLSKMHCDHKSSVELIWGPPGTGKTKTVSLLLWSVLGMNYRILACAPSNIAVTELASRVVKLVKESSENNSEPCALFCSLGDLLLFGNKDRLNVGSDLEDIYLDYRVDRLLECFGQPTGWKQCFTSMIDFLEGSIFQYHIFLEKSLCKKKSFYEFAREQFRFTALPLRRYIQILCTHTPKSIILERNFQNMVSLTELLDAFESLLSQNDVASAELEEPFTVLEVVENSQFSFWYEPALSHVRMQCLCLLRTLQSSLDHLRPPRIVNKDSIKKLCFQWAALIFCTASNSHKLSSMVTKPLNLLVIDEAAQLKECESTIPLQLPGLRHAILIGDEYQLPATVNSKVSDGAGFGRSLFERLSVLGHSKHLLAIQYRMQPLISYFPNSQFYRNQILDASNVKNRSYVKHYLPGPMFGPYSFISVSGGREQVDVGHSLKNLVEAAVVVKIVQNLYKAFRGCKQKLSIGVVSPYAAQVMAIREKLGRKFDNFDHFTVKVKSIDGFQGGEEDIIIISTVRSNTSGSIGFLSNQQRTNVALTRARHCLWILGNGTTLSNSGSIWQAVVHDAKIRQCFFNADEDKDLAKPILDVKEELLELDDFLCQDSILFRTSRWEVLISNNFGQSLRKLKSTKIKKSVIFFLLRLSTGWRPTDKNRGLIAEESSLTMFQHKVEGFYIVWTIDIKKDSEYIQVLKVWDILTPENVPVLVKSLDRIFQTYTSDFLTYCKAKCLEGDLEVPMSWAISSDLVQYKNLTNTEANGDSNATVLDRRTYFGQSNVKENLLLVKFYLLSSRVVTHLLSGRDIRELDFLYQVKDHELEIIHCPRTTFMVGRPSSGKITVLTTKIFQKEWHHYVALEEHNMDVTWKNNVEEGLEKTKETVLRQIFVTVSPKQCAAVKHHLSHLKSFTFAAKFSAEKSSIDMHDIDDVAHSVDIPDNFVDIPPKSYPLVITFQKFLVMLDGTVGDSYLERFHDLKEHSHAKSRGSSSFALKYFVRTKEVNYDRFTSSYWPHFDIQQRKKLDAFTVFTEIIFHIKGSTKAAEACDDKVSRDDYVLLARDEGSALSRRRREKIYDIFLAYEQKKTENGEFDLADLVIDLHRRLEKERYEGDKMDFVYVDEVQDLTMREITLFKYICRNVHEGFIWSADRARTVARGADFRLQDIQSLFYKDFILGSRNSRINGGIKEGQISDIFHLSWDIHTHSGLLNIAQSVMDLLFRFFPLSVDILCPEECDSSLSSGELPVLLDPGKDENAVITIFGSSSEKVGKSNVGFGAEQVILVRDDCARKEIAALIGNQSLVLTIMECQGIEFQDVFLYNFFGSSPFKSQWEIIYEYMEEQDILDSTISRSFLSSNQAKHIGLCLELKLLYMAITRSSHRLWISENVKELSNPMFNYWRKKHLIQIKQVDYLPLQSMQVVSCKEDWRSQGIKLYCEGRNEMAMMCFRRAGDRYRENWAEATSLKTAAGSIRGSNPEMAYKVLSRAAGIFHSIRRIESAAHCFIDIMEYEKAGRIYLKKCGESRLEDAGDCFLMAGCYKLAAEAYGKGSYIAKCLSICISRKFYELGLQFIVSRRQHATPDVGMVKSSPETEKIEHDFLEKCALYYHELQDEKSMMKFVKAFHSMDSKRSCLKTLNCFNGLLLLEKDSGNFMEAAGIAKLKGDILLEVDLLEKAGCYKNASLLILLYVFVNSLWVSGNKGWPLKPFRRKENLLTKAKLFAAKDSDNFYELVCTEVNILSNQPRSPCELKKYCSDSKRQQNLRGVILSSRKMLDAHLQSSILIYEWVDGQVMDIMKLSEERETQNCISIDTLVCCWNIWKENILNIIEYLTCLETQDANENILLREFCVNYFGVRKVVYNDDIIYLLLNPDAEWVTKINDRLLKRKGDLVSVDTCQFVSFAKTYWCSEVLSVGLKVLENLKALHDFSTRSCFPKSCQSRTAIHIFEVTRSLIECNFLGVSMDDRTRQKFYDMGLQSVRYLKNSTGDPGMLNGSQRMGRIIHNFLVKCALHYHSLNDKRTMIKFVRAFCSMNSRRSFLKSLDCFDELMCLEEESGNFVEAATIAKSKGDLLLEIALLGKAGCYKDASMLILFYVLSNSLWASGSKGWPLKQFRHKEKLLTKAKTFAENDSDLLQEFVCTEANILSNQKSSLFELKQYLDTSQRQMNLRGVILSAWKILDALLRLDPSSYEWGGELATKQIGHLGEEMVSQNWTSIETLVYFWNFWKERILNIFEYLSCLEVQNVNVNMEYEEFCLSYMGVRKEFDIENSMYMLFNSNADWFTEIQNGSLEMDGKLVSINAVQFVTAARKYWRLEVLTVGIKVLELLEVLYVFSVRNALPMFCQSVTALRFFEVSKFLIDSKFFELSTSEILENFENIRLRFIQFSVADVAQNALALDSNQEIQEIEHAFLEKCALRYHELQDRRIMMNFVQAFHSMDSKRTFLKTLHCFDELLLLEQESGNFMEAASIARQKGDIFLEVDLLQKAGHFEDAAMLILSYVLTKSLWAAGSKGWPLKQFVQKEELLEKAKSFAYNHSNVFYEFVRTEASILAHQESSLTEMKGYFNTSQRNNSIVGEILCARKILDAHLNSNISKYEWENEIMVDKRKLVEDRISKNQISIETLVYFWDFWKEKVVNIFKYLRYLETQDVTGYRSYEKFCLSYFGVSKQFDEQNAFYLLIDSDAGWVKKIDDRCLRWSGNLFSLKPQQFVTAAQSYWSSEVFSVGMEVLKSLGALLVFSTRNPVPLFHQSMIAIHIFSVTKFLMGSEFLEKSPDDRILRSFFELSIQHFFENVFPLDWTKPMTENMVILRGTTMSRNALEEIVFKNINSESELTYGKIGRVAMIMLGSGKLSIDLYEMAAKRFDLKPPWRAFIDAFKGHVMGSEFAKDSMSRKINDASGEASLVLTLHDALSDAYNIDWRQELEYISPHCFLYLLERFLIMVSCYQERLFTTKASFTEWLVSQELSISSSTGLVTDAKSSLPDGFDLMASIIHQLLVNKCETIEWIVKSNMNADYYSHLVLRLVVLICLLCLNSAKYFNVLHDLIGRADICSQLPLEFSEALKRKQKRSCKFVDLLAKALRKINPLVIVSWEDDCPTFPCQDAIVMYRKDIHCRDKSLRLLFSENVEDNDQACVIESKALKSFSYGLYLSCNDQEKSVEERTNGDMRSCLSAAPVVELENIVHCLSAAMTQSFWNSPCNDDGRTFENLNNGVYRLKQVSMSSIFSDDELKNNISPAGSFSNNLSDRNDVCGASQTSITAESQKKTEDANSKAKNNINSKKGKTKTMVCKPRCEWKRKK